MKSEFSVIEEKYVLCPTFYWFIYCYIKKKKTYFNSIIFATETFLSRIVTVISVSTVVSVKMKNNIRFNEVLTGR